MRPPFGGKAAILCEFRANTRSFWLSTQSADSLRCRERILSKPAEESSDWPMSGWKPKHRLMRIGRHSFHPFMSTRSGTVASGSQGDCGGPCAVLRLLRLLARLTGAFVSGRSALRRQLAARAGGFRIDTSLTKMMSPRGREGRAHRDQHAGGKCAIRAPSS